MYRSNSWFDAIMARVQDVPAGFPLRSASQMSDEASYEVLDKDEGRSKCLPALKQMYSHTGSVRALESATRSLHLTTSVLLMIL